MAAAELCGKVNAYQDTLQPIQDNLNGLRQKAEAIAHSLSQSQESSQHQVQAIHEIREIIQHLASQ